MNIRTLNTLIYIVYYTCIVAADCDITIKGKISQWNSAFEIIFQNT